MKIKIFTPNNIIYGVGSAIVAGALTMGALDVYDKLFGAEKVPPTYVNNSTDLDNNRKNDFVLSVKGRKRPEVLLRQNDRLIRLEDKLRKELGYIDSREKEELRELERKYDLQRTNAIPRI